MVPATSFAGVAGRPSAGSAIWHLPEGPFRYAEFRFAPGAIRYNVAPADVAARPPERGGAGLAAYAMSPVTTAMTRRMLLGIKRRAESGAVRQPAGTAGTRR